jgi:hypothetical protein
MILFEHRNTITSTRIAFRHGVRRLLAFVQCGCVRTVADEIGNDYRAVVLHRDV